MHIKQLKSDVAGPILFQGDNFVERSTNFTWDNAASIFNVNGSMFVNGAGGNNISFDAVSASVTHDTIIQLVLGANAFQMSTLDNVFTDNINGKGIEYAGDYSANFTANSLVTKAYVDNHVPAQYWDRYASFSGDVLRTTPSIFGDLPVVPNTTNAQDLGTLNYRWRNVYTSGTVNFANDLTFHSSASNTARITILGAGGINILDNVVLSADKTITSAHKDFNTIRIMYSAINVPLGGFSGRTITDTITGAVALCVGDDSIYLTFAINSISGGTFDNGDSFTSTGGGVGSFTSDLIVESPTGYGSQIVMDNFFVAGYTSITSDLGNGVTGQLKIMPSYVELSSYSVVDDSLIMVETNNNSVVLADDPNVLPSIVTGLFMNPALLNLQYTDPATSETKALTFQPNGIQLLDNAAAGSLTFGTSNASIYINELNSGTAVMHASYTQMGFDDFYINIDGDRAITDGNIGTIADNLFGRGLQYVADYSASFVSESLITKRYVDDSIAALANGVVLTAPNGSTWQVTVLNNGALNTTLLTPPQSVPLNGLKIWLDANEPSSVTINSNGTGGTPSDGGAVGMWMDISGNANHINQMTAANRPTYNVNALNGLPVLTFDGVNDFMKAASFDWNRPETIYIVVNRLTDAGTIFDGNSVNQGRLFAIGGNTVQVYAGDYGVAAVIPSGFNIIKVTIEASGTSIAVNGGIATTNGNAQTQDMDGFTLGTLGFAGGESNIAVAEVIGYDRILSGGEDGIVTSYLQTKYNI